MKAKKTTGAAGVEVFNKLFSYRLEQAKMWPLAHSPGEFQAYMAGVARTLSELDMIDQKTFDELMNKVLEAVFSLINGSEEGV